MTTVKNTLDSALPAGAQDAYPVPYRDVLTALTERDYRLTDAIVETVHRHFGTSKETIQGQLEGIGMAVRPAPAPAVPDVAAFEALYNEPAFVGTEKLKKGKKDSVKKLAKQVKKLTRLARDHGLTV